jgi:hypothetical protein
MMDIRSAIAAAILKRFFPVSMSAKRSGCALKRDFFAS